MRRAIEIVCTKATNGHSLELKHEKALEQAGILRQEHGYGHQEHFDGYGAPEHGGNMRLAPAEQRCPKEIEKLFDAYGPEWFEQMVAKEDIDHEGHEKQEVGQSLRKRIGHDISNVQILDGCGDDDRAHEDKQEIERPNAQDAAHIEAANGNGARLGQLF